MLQKSRQWESGKDLLRQSFLSHSGRGRLWRLLILLVVVKLSGLRSTQALTAPFAYITNMGSDSVSIIDIATNAVTATVPMGEAPRGGR